MKTQPFDNVRLKRYVDSLKTNQLSLTQQLDIRVSGLESKESGGGLKALKIAKIAL